MKIGAPVGVLFILAAASCDSGHLVGTIKSPGDGEAPDATSTGTGGISAGSGGRGGDGGNGGSGVGGAGGGTSDAGSDAGSDARGDTEVAGGDASDAASDGSSDGSGNGTFSCGSSACLVGADYCSSYTPGTPGSTSRNCSPFPTSCGATPTCACLCPMTTTLGYCTNSAALNGGVSAVCTCSDVGSGIVDVTCLGQ